MRYGSPVALPRDRTDRMNCSWSLGFRHRKLNWRLLLDSLGSHYRCSSVTWIFHLFLLLLMKWQWAELFRKGATASKGLPSGNVVRRWEDSDARPLRPNAAISSTWPPQSTVAVPFVSYLFIAVKPRCVLAFVCAQFFRNQLRNLSCHTRFQMITDDLLSDHFPSWHSSERDPQDSGTHQS